MPRPRPLSKTQYETLAAFRYALRLFLRFSEEEAQALGITPQQHQALLAIKGFPKRDSVTVKELAERLQLRHHSAAELVNRLLEDNLVTRTPSTQDRRYVLIRLTARGENVLAKLSLAHSRQLRHMGPELKLLLGRLGSANE